MKPLPHPSPENCAFFFAVQTILVHSLLPLPMAPTSRYFSSAMDYGSCRSSVSVYTYYLTFCSWLISRVTRFVHIVTLVMISFPLKPSYAHCLCMPHFYSMLICPWGTGFSSSLFLFDFYLLLRSRYMWSDFSYLVVFFLRQGLSPMYRTFLASDSLCT